HPPQGIEAAQPVDHPRGFRRTDVARRRRGPAPVRHPDREGGHRTRRRDRARLVRGAAPRARGAVAVTQRAGDDVLAAGVGTARPASTVAAPSAVARPVGGDSTSSQSTWSWSACSPPRRPNSRFAYRRYPRMARLITNAPTRNGVTRWVNSWISK